MRARRWRWAVSLGVAAAVGEAACLGQDIDLQSPAARARLGPPMIVPALIAKPVAWQAPDPGQPGMEKRGLEAKDGLLVSIKTVPPGPEELFRLEKEDDLFDRMRQEARRRPLAPLLQFPVASRRPPVQSSMPRSWGSLEETVEPNALCYGRLFFEDRNSERHGWDLGPVQPFVSTGAFFLDLAAVPLRLAADPLRVGECNSGLCLPGDPVPYLVIPCERK